MIAVVVLLIPHTAAQAQESSCAPNCALRIEHGLLGDRLFGADGRQVGRSLVSASDLQRTVAGVPAAEQWAVISTKADRRARIWGGISSIATVALLVAQSNNMQAWKKSDQNAMIWGSAASGLVFGTIAGQQLRIAQTARGAAVQSFNDARSRR
jgi:hypothetical protein